MSALVWSDILRLFVNTLTADNKYCRCNVHNFVEEVQTPLSQKKRVFAHFLLYFWNVHEI